MTALGHSRRFQDVRVTSAFPPIATAERTFRHVSKVVIGAGSVVTRDIAEGVFAAGNPCRVICEITE
jgi:2-keto-3-deoxy-6-phosphogluconate aldolase